MAHGDSFQRVPRQRGETNFQKGAAITNELADRNGATGRLEMDDA